MLQGEIARGHTNHSSRRVLNFMRFDRDSGHFVPTEKRKQNHVTVGYKVDAYNHRILQGMLDKDEGLNEARVQMLPTKVMDRGWQTRGPLWYVGAGS